MTSVGEEEVEYESDPEEIKRSLAMRRREASDDEEGEGEGEDDKSRIDRRAGIHSDESDGQGGAAEYDDDEEVLDMDEEEEEEIYDEEEEEEEEIDEEEVEGDKKEMDRNNDRGGASGTGGLAVVKEVEGDGGRNLEEAMDGHVGKLVEEEQEKKENEPFAVPTAGAFYMHDDRFRDNAGGRHRRTHVGRKLWESKDDKKWGHDKFEEMNLQERHYEEGRRSSRGRYRARGKNRGPDRGYPRGSRAKAFNGSNNQNQLPKGGMRGRGPRRSEPGTKNSGQASSTQNKQMGKALEKTLQTNTGRALMPTTESASAPAKKHVFASSLSSASPPFYPSGSSNKEINLTQKRDLQAGGVSRNLRTSVMDENFSVPQANALLRGKNIVDSAGLDKLYIDDSSSSAAGKTLNNLQMPSSGHSSVNTTQSSQSRAQGRHITGQMPYQSGSPNNQVNRVSVPAQHYNVQRGSVQSRIQSSSQATGQQSGQRPGSGSQASSPPKTALSISSYEAGEVESSETGKSKGTLVGKGKGSIPGSGRGSFLYNGAQVTGAAGNVAVGHGDQNFPATPAFLPVMQFGGQHPGGIGVPAVGMAFPGYVAQPQLGLGNSEMTWLPVLAGAAGALGATYCSPYIAVDGSYHARPAGQTSSIGSSSKENNTNKPNSEWKPSQRPEPVSDEFGQRQNNPNKQPRRYSEMSFSK